MQLNEYIDNISLRIQGARVLDIGCLGSFHDTILVRHNHYKKAAKEIVGLDYNADLLAKVKATGAKNLHYCDIADVDMVKQIQKKLGTFEHVIATDIIEHIGNLTIFLDNVKRFMSKDGSLYITTPNIRSPSWLAMWAGEARPLFNYDHICWFDLDTIKTLLNRSNFKIQRIFYCTYIRDKEYAKLFRLKWKSWMSRRLYIIARRMD